MQSVLSGCSQPQRSFFPSFFNHFLAFLVRCIPLWSSGSSSFSTAHFTATTFKVLLCCLTFSLSTSFWHPERCCTVSRRSPYNLHVLHPTNPPIFVHALVSMIFSCNAKIYVFLGYISTSQSLLHYIALVFHFEAPQPNFVYSFFVLHSRSFSVFPSFFPFSITMTKWKCNFLIKWYSYLYISHCFFCFLFQWYLFSLQGSINYVHNEEHVCNVHTKIFSRAQNYVHINQWKHL